MIFGPVLASKMASKIMKKPIRRRSRKGVDFGTHFKRPRTQLLARPGGMRGALGENKRGGSRGPESRDSCAALNGPARRAHRRVPGRCSRRCRRCPADPRAPCGATPAGHRFLKRAVRFYLRFGRLPFTLRVFARSCAPMFSPCSHPVVAYFGGVLKYILIER